jgi:hypothetical protein
MRKAKSVKSIKRHKRSLRTSRSKLPTGKSKHKRNRSMLKKSSGGLRSAYEAGLHDAASLPGGGGAVHDAHWLKLQINESWTRRCGRRGAPTVSESMLIKQGKAYVNGFTDALHWPRQLWLPLPLRGTAAAVVLAGGGRPIDPASLREVLRLPLQEIIVVLEDSDGLGYGVVRSVPGITVVHPGEPLGRDIGRAVGANISRMDIVLFMDGSTKITAERLAPFLTAVDNRADIAISDTTAPLGAFRNWDDLSRVRAFINWSLKRPDLLANSVTVLPNAWSRKAIEKVRTAALAIPPIAHLAAIDHNLKIVVCQSIRQTQLDDDSTKLSIGDHIEALKAAMALKGSRLNLHDRNRRRGAVGGTGR